MEKLLPAIGVPSTAGLLLVRMSAIFPEMIQPLSLFGCAQFHWIRCVLTPARNECLPWFQEIWSPVRKLFWRLWVAEKKFPPALHDPHCDPGNPSVPMTGTRESSRLWL